VATAEILTVGHSTLPYQRFVELLRRAGVTAIADVRTAPYSRRVPQFNRETLVDALRGDGISYVYLGQELGGRPADRRFYCDGVADYEKMATAELFKDGLRRLLDGAGKFRIAVMCAEHDPLDCHRCLLVGRALAAQGVRISHIMSDGAVLPHAQIEDRLLQLAGRGGDDLFATRAEQLAIAYRARARTAAFAEPPSGINGPMAAERES
jgi:uncharacterized protein (DUF488 family)